MHYCRCNSKKSYLGVAALVTFPLSLLPFLPPFPISLFPRGARDSMMALWSVSTLEEHRGSNGEGLLAEEVKSLEPIVKFSNLGDTESTAQCERVRSIAYSKDTYVSEVIIFDYSLIQFLFKVNITMNVWFIIIMIIMMYIGKFLNMQVWKSICVHFPSRKSFSVITQWISKFKL